jgi:TPP-dependent pyruvate/acetoin dehydrogenase alpha subunit
MEKESRALINEAVARVERLDIVAVGDMFQHVYEDLPVRIRREMHDWRQE